MGVIGVIANESLTRPNKEVMGVIGVNGAHVGVNKLTFFESSIQL